MKRFLLVALALTGANGWVDSAQAADQCPGLVLNNASGSPRVVQGQTVQFTAWNSSPVASIFLDGNFFTNLSDPIANQPPYIMPATIVGLSYGAHTLQNASDACVVNFTVVPIPTNPTLTSGHQWWEVGSGTEHQVTHYYGFIRGWNMGAMSPTTTPDGKTYDALYDMMECTIFGCYEVSGFSISGFSSNPGIGWLHSITALGVTRTGAEAAGYSFSGTTATWTWQNAFGLGTASAIPITLSHN